MALCFNTILFIMQNLLTKKENKKKEGYQMVIKSIFFFLIKYKYLKINTLCVIDYYPLTQHSEKLAVN